MSTGPTSPSPPWTRINPNSQSTSLSSIQSHPDSPPPSPKLHTNSNSPPAIILPSPLPPLSAEAFFAVVSFLPQSARPALALVSRAWYNFLKAEPRLWPELAVSLHHDQADHVELWAARAGLGQDVRGAGVKALKLTLACQRTARAQYGDIVSHVVMAHRMVHVIRLLDQKSTSGERGTVLESLEVLSMPNTFATLNLLTAVASFADAPFARSLKS